MPDLVDGAAVAGLGSLSRIGRRRPEPGSRGAEAGEHYFLVCVLGDGGELDNVIPHRYVLSTDGRLVHGFDGLGEAEREEVLPDPGAPHAHRRGLWSATASSARAGSRSTCRRCTPCSRS